MKLVIVELVCKGYRINITIEDLIVLIVQVINDFFSVDKRLFESSHKTTIKLYLDSKRES